MSGYPGGQTVYLVDLVPVADGEGEPVLDEYLNPVTADRVLRVDGCLFETLSTDEDQSTVTVTSEVARVFLPVADGTIPVVGDAGPVAHPWTALTSRSRVRCNGREYQMRGDAVLEVDIDGFEDHVLARCERQQG